MDFLVGLLSIIMVNLLLSGDNALVIALASRGLPHEQQKSAVFWGGAGAIVMRIALTFIAVYLLRIPYLQFAGGLLLLWVATKLTTQQQHKPDDVVAAGSLWGAIRTILVADLVMSLDNVIAIAAVAKGNITLLVVGLGISIPLIIWGSQMMMKLMERWPIIVLIGAAFLGWTAGEMVTADQKVVMAIAEYPWAHWLIPALFAAVVVVIDVIKKKEQQGLS